jgi:hypothetical protein
MYSMTERHERFNFTRWFIWALKLFLAYGECLNRIHFKEHDDREIYVITNFNNLLFP